ncbi:MAG: polysaccharide deacetylase family protein [Dechloromonas sp.]|nr:MAG: polysaccharide deacetylase family protein [Dechloromonas sp.]
MIALVGTWMDVPDGEMVDYDGQPVPRGKFLSWAQVREMQDSGLIEVASHSYDLHHGILANPQGNTQPATTTRLYANGRYEDDAAYLARLRHSLRDSISQHTGKAPRIIVWPYGRSNLAAQEVAARLGMPIGLTLVDGFNDATTPTAVWKRQLIENSPTLQAFAEMLRVTWAPNPGRSVQVDPAPGPRRGRTVADPRPPADTEPQHCLRQARHRARWARNDPVPDQTAAGRRRQAEPHRLADRAPGRRAGVHRPACHLAG